MLVTRVSMLKPAATHAQLLGPPCTLALLTTGIVPVPCDTVCASPTGFPIEIISDLAWQLICDDSSAVSSVKQGAVTVEDITRFCACQEIG